MDKDLEYYNSLPQPDYSVKHRKRMNRFFREQIKSSNIPYPEVDNYYERIRSKIKIKSSNSKRKKVGQ